MNTGEERFEFTAKAKKNLIITIVVGLILAVIGVVALQKGGSHGDASHDKVEMSQEGGGHGEAASGETSGHHGSPTWLKRACRLSKPLKQL